MILSNSEIFRALDERRLIITPEPAPRTAPSDGTRYPFQTSSVDLRLGHEIAYFKDDLPVSIDMRGGKFNTLFGANSISHRITKEQPYYLQTGKFVLGNTLERVELPIMDSDTSLAARVEGRSSLARCGLLVHFTAPTIHAGFNGRITLEMINLGPVPILLYPEMDICQLILEEVRGIPIPRESQFQGQTRPGGA